MNPQETRANTRKVQDQQGVPAGATIYAFTRAGTMVWGYLRGASPQHVHIDVQGLAYAHNGDDGGPLAGYMGEHRAKLPSLLLTHRYERDDRGVPHAVQIASDFAWPED